MMPESTKLKYLFSPIMMCFIACCSTIRRPLSNNLTNRAVQNHSRIGYVIQFKWGKVGVLDDRQNFVLLFTLNVWSDQNRMICLPGLHRLPIIKSNPSP
jgi:hypothetical protein